MSLAATFILAGGIQELIKDSALHVVVIPPQPLIQHGPLFCLFFCVSWQVS